MGLGTAIRRIFNRGETAPIDPRKGQSWWMAMPYVPDGLGLTVHQAFEVSAVWACCNLIANSIAAAPWYTLAVNKDGRRSKLVDDALAYLLNVAPNPETTAQALKEAVLWQALIYGNGYAEIVPDRGGRISQLWPLLSERMLPPTRAMEPDPAGRWKVGDLVYDYVNPEGQTKRLPASGVFHLRGPSLEGLVGQGTVLAAAKAISTGAAQDRFTLSYFANAATPSGVLTVQKFLQPKDRAELKAEFAAKHSAHRNNGTPLVLDGGTTWNPVSNDPQKSQLVEGRQFSIEEIARYFGVPLHLLASPQGSQGYGKNLSEMGHALINFGLMPWTKRLEQEAQIKLIPARTSKVTVIDLSYLSRGTEKEMAEADEIRIRSGVVTINECREDLGKNHGPAELDHHLVLTTVQPIEKALAPPAPAPAPGAPGATAPKAPGGADPEEDGAGGTQIGTDEPAAHAAADLLSRALTDHARRWKARRKDLEANTPPAEVEAKLEAARAELRAKVPGFEVECAAVEEGVDPEKVARHRFRLA